MSRILYAALVCLGSFACGNESDTSGMIVVVANCADGVENGDETGIDCGGGCAVCADGASCAQNSDCATGACDDGACAAPDSCGNGSECESGVCTDGACAQSSCDDAVQNGDESGPDCGGLCAACPEPECALNADCASGICSEGVCGQPACDDGVANGSETAIDCGGTCTACADGLTCAESSDCASENCADGMCAPTVAVYPEGPYGTSVGDTVMDLVLGTSEGAEVSFGEIRAEGGRLMLIFSTGAWCGRCAGDMPELIELHERYHARGLQMRVSLFESSDHGTPQTRDAQLYGRGNNLPFPVVIDPQGKLHQFFPRLALPMVMVVDLASMELLHAAVGWDVDFFDMLIGPRVDEN